MSTLANPTDARWAALAVLCVGMLMIVLDGTVVNVALPSIQSDLGFSQSNLAWLINAYMIAFGGLLLLAGRLGDFSFTASAGGSIAAILFAAFIARQATATKPLLPLRLFRSRTLCGSNALQVLLVAGMFDFFFLDPLYLGRVLGYDAVATGFAFLPVTLAIGALSIRWSAQLAIRFGPRKVIIAGVGTAAPGLAIAAVTPLSINYLALFPSMLLLGLGMGASFPSLMMFAMQSATSRDSGLISGLINTTAQVGGAFGLAILATLAAVTSYQIAFAAAAACLAGASLIAATVLQSPAPHPGVA